MQQSRPPAYWLLPLCLLLCECSGRNEPLEETFERTYPIESNAVVDLIDVDGSIEVYGSRQPEIHIHATKKAYTASRLRAISVDVAAQPDSISINTTFPGPKTWSFSDRSGTVDYVIVVPQTARIGRLELNNGEILVNGMEAGSIDVKLGNGRLFFRNCFSDLKARESTGALIFIYDWWNPRRFSAEARITDGNLFAIFPGEASFHLMAEAPNGKIGNDFSEKEERTAERIRQVNASVGPSPQATFALRALDGNIKIIEANP